ncbi:MAG: septum formation initiator family protein [Nitrospirae bacterium]|nr:septum formation initiator family protein [Nitrospirota bacterium]
MKNNLKKEDLEGIRKKRRIVLWMAGGFVAIYFILSFLFSDLGFIRYIKMRATHNQLKEDISRLEDENRRFKKDAEALKSDPEYIEKLARERLGLVKEGETVYQYNEK